MAFHKAPAVQGAGARTSFQEMFLVVFIGCIYIAISAGMINFNKWLMQPTHFPFAIHLTLMHMIFSTVLCGSLYLFFPSLFPALAQSNPKRMELNAELMGKRMLPIAVCFCGQLVFSNQAYKFCSVAFLQMLKEGNVLLVYILALFCGMEFYDRRKVFLLMLLLGFLTLTIHGEMHFSLIGVIIQASGQLFECSKITLQAMLLSGSGQKLDALSYVLVVGPISTVVLGTVLAATTSGVFITMAAPTWEIISSWWPTLLLNCCVAFALNVSIAAFVQVSSGVAFVLAGIVKDAAIVLVGVALMGEQISGTQAVGFLGQLFLIMIWSLLAKFPEMFGEKPEALDAKAAAYAETRPLLEGKGK
eukprot:TRINITY_DN45849_c0_g1_i1.p2 TRINITY_DN45849_c0_g1~~TRINITY_DN45849_c0_g1_i1.p2  ORF type:complete len:360 (-),score=91.51 TRINITY_DN45849_c0_g1_i1:52-1131(-)